VTSVTTSSAFKVGPPDFLSISASFPHQSESISVYKTLTCVNGYF